MRKKIQPILRLVSWLFCVATVASEASAAPRKLQSVNSEQKIAGCSAITQTLASLDSGIFSKMPTLMDKPSMLRSSPSREEVSGGLVYQDGRQTDQFHLRATEEGLELCETYSCGGGPRPIKTIKPSIGKYIDRFIAWGEPNSNKSRDEFAAVQFDAHSGRTKIELIQTHPTKKIKRRMMPIDLKVRELSDIRFFPKDYMVGFVENQRDNWGFPQFRLFGVRTNNIPLFSAGFELTPQYKSVVLNDGTVLFGNAKTIHVSRPDGSYAELPNNIRSPLFEAIENFKRTKNGLFRIPVQNGEIVISKEGNIQHIKAADVTKEQWRLSSLEKLRPIKALEGYHNEFVNSIGIRSRTGRPKLFTNYYSSADPVTYSIENGRLGVYRRNHQGAVFANDVSITKTRNDSHFFDNDIFLFDDRSVKFADYWKRLGIDSAVVPIVSEFGPEGELIIHGFSPNHWESSGFKINNSRDVRAISEKSLLIINSAGDQPRFFGITDREGYALHEITRSLPLERDENGVVLFRYDDKVYLSLPDRTYLDLTERMGAYEPGNALAYDEHGRTVVSTAAGDLLIAEDFSIYESTGRSTKKLWAKPPVIARETTSILPAIMARPLEPTRQLAVARPLQQRQGIPIARPVVFAPQRGKKSFLRPLSSEAVKTIAEIRKAPTKSPSWSQEPDAYKVHGEMYYRAAELIARPLHAIARQNKLDFDAVKAIAGVDFSSDEGIKKFFEFIPEEALNNGNIQNASDLFLKKFEEINDRAAGRKY